MNYLKKTFEIVKKNMLLIIPLLVFTIIPRYLYDSTSLFNEEYLKKLLFPPNTAPLAIPKLLNTTKALVAFIVGGGLVSFLLMFIIIPGTYGMINKAVDNENASLLDFIPSIKKYFTKYLSITLTRLLIWLIYAFASLMLIIFFMTLLFIPENIHIPIVISVIVIVLLFALFIHICQCLWISIVIREGTDTERGLKKSFRIVYHMFPSFASVFILFKAVGLALEALLYRLVSIPVIRPVITGIIPALVQFILITYYLVVYKDKSKPKYLND